MKLTHKAVARAAGYYAYEESGNGWGWYDKHGWSLEEHDRGFWWLTEEGAYKDCCEACGLIEKNPEQGAGTSATSNFTGEGGPR